jgi:Holliday junction resolvase
VGGYSTGYRLERRVQRLYTKHGWLATRFPKSGRGIYPADVLALKRLDGKTYIHIIECKNASKEDKKKKNAIYIEVGQIQRLLKTADKHQAQALVAFSFPRKHARIIHVDRLMSSGKMLYIKQRDGVLIKDFLKEFM